LDSNHVDKNISPSNVRVKSTLNPLAIPWIPRVGYAQISNIKTALLSQLGKKSPRVGTPGSMGLDTTPYINDITTPDISIDNQV